MSEVRIPLRRPPLNHRFPIEGNADAVRMAEVPFLAKFVLRVDPQAAVEPLRSALGLGLPFDPLTSSSSGDTAFLWMGPDEWMLVTSPDGAPSVSARSREALAALHHQLVDVGDYYTAIDVAGPKARELLMKLTTIDLHPRAFHAAMVTGAILGRANATLWLMADDASAGGPTFRLFIRWSMADYLWCVLADAGREWGVPEQVPVKGETLVAHA